MNIEVGTVLIAKDPCVMEETGKNALIVGKEYPVDYMNTIYFGIKSEVDEKHIFGFDEYKSFFKVKKIKSEVIKMSFKDAPVGARFKYIGLDKIFVKINSYPKSKFEDGCGLICEWNGNIKGPQGFYSFVDEEDGINFDTEIELV